MGTPAGCFDAGKGLLCEPVGEVKSDWATVTAGQGEYVMVQPPPMYEWVGAGKGDIKQVEIQSATWRIKIWVLVLLFFLGLVIAALVLYFLLQTPKDSEVKNLESDFNSDVDHHPDCFKDFYRWREVWSTEKQAYCCRTAKRACAPEHVFVKTRVILHGPAPPPKVVVRNHYVKIPDPEVEMHTKYVMLPTPTERPEIVTKYKYKYMTPKRPDCDSGYFNWKDKWDSRKKEWCCDHENKACYDCAAGASNWRDGWSQRKKEWCCQENDRFCDYEDLHEE